MLCEYGNVGNTVYNIWRSTNDGVTWTKVLSSPGTDPQTDPGADPEAGDGPAAARPE